MSAQADLKRGDRVAFERIWCGRMEEFEGVIVSVDGRWDSVLQDNVKVVRNARVNVEGGVVVVPVEELRILAT